MASRLNQAMHERRERRKVRKEEEREKRKERTRGPGEKILVLLTKSTRSNCGF